MNLLVVDASVAVKWVLPAYDEPLSEQASKLFGRFVKEEAQFLAPDLLWAEFGNVMWKAARRGRCTPARAQAALDALLHLNITSMPSQPMIEDALGLAIDFNCTVYDSLYVVLAINSGTQLITADEKLVQSFPAPMPVKWLGAVS